MKDVKTLKQILCLLLAAMMLFAFAGCGGTEEEVPAPETAEAPAAEAAPEAETAPEAEAAPEGGIIAGSVVNYALPSDIANYLPTTTTSVPSWIVMGAIFEGLMWYENGSGQPQPCLAESYELSDDGLVYTFHIRQGVKFSDGSDLNAHDFAYSWEAYKGVNESQFSTIEGWECPDDYTFVVTMKEPRASFINEICDIFWVAVSKEAYEEYGTLANEAAIGTGPYYVESYVPGSRMVLKANPNYWKNEVEDLKQYGPKIETINMEIITDANTAFIALQTGDIDIIRELNATQITMLEGNPDYEVTNYPNPCIDTLFFNTSCAPFDDPAVREAISYLINKDDVNAAAYDSNGVVTSCPWPNNNGLYKDYSDLYSYDVDKGLQILADAGYAPEDISFEILAPSSSELQVLAVENIQAQLLALGMDISVTTYDRPTYMSYIRDKDYQCAIHDIGTTNEKNQAWANSFVSDGLNHFNNFIDSNPELQAKLDTAWTEAMGCTTMAEQNDILRAATDLLAAEYAFLPLVENSVYFACNADLDGLVVNHDTLTRFYGLNWAE